VIQAVLTGWPRSSSSCLIHVGRDRPGGHLQSGAGRIPMEASVKSCRAPGVHVLQVRVDRCGQARMITVGCYEWQNLETSRR